MNVHFHVRCLPNSFGPFIYERERLKKQLESLLARPYFLIGRGGVSKLLGRDASAAEEVALHILHSSLRSQGNRVRKWRMEPLLLRSFPWPPGMATEEEEEMEASAQIVWAEKEGPKFD